MNTAATEGQPNIRRDGLEIFFFRNVATAPAQDFDIFSAFRASTADGWSGERNLGPNVNAANANDSRRRRSHPAHFGPTSATDTSPRRCLAWSVSSRAARGLPRARAERLAAELDIGLDVPVCYACLSFVSLALDGGDPVDVARQARHITPYIWSEGLAEPAFAAVQGAVDRGVPHAQEGLADLARRGGRSSVARAIVVRLADELSQRMHMQQELTAAARERLPLAPPELN